MYFVEYPPWNMSDVFLMASLRFFSLGRTILEVKSYSQCIMPRAIILVMTWHCLH